MTLKGVFDRKLIMLIVSPLVRRLGTALAVYLASKGAPADQLDQLLTAVAAVLGISFDIVLATIEKKRVQSTAMQKAFDIVDSRPWATPFDERRF